MKKFIVVISILIAGLYFAVQYGGGYAGAIAIEQLGSQATGGTVTVDDVSISIIEGKVDISGLAMSGMDGFGPDDTVAVKDISLTVDTTQLGGETLALEQLIMDSPVISYALPEGIGGLGPLIQQAKQQGGNFGGGGTSLPGGGPQVSIDDLQVSNGTVSINVAGQTVSVPMPDINAQGVGGENGTSAEAVIQQVMGQVMANASGALSNLDLNALAQGQGGGGLQSQIDAAKGAISNFGSSAADKLKELMDQ